MGPIAIWEAMPPAVREAVAESQRQQSTIDELKERIVRLNGYLYEANQQMDMMLRCVRDGLSGVYRAGRQEVAFQLVVADVTLSHCHSKADVAAVASDLQRQLMLKLQGYLNGGDKEVMEVFSGPTSRNKIGSTRALPALL